MEQTRQPVQGVVLAVLAAFAFGIGGPFGKSLYEIGWSSSAVVMARCLGVLAVLLVPALLALRGRWPALRRNAGVVAAYGAFAVVGAQFSYYTAIRFMPVGAALLIEYLAPVLLIGLAWLRTRRRPGGLVLAGCAAAIAGLALVVDLGDGRTEPIGLVFAFASTVGLAVYFVISTRVDPELPTVVLLAGSMVVGVVVLSVLAAVGAAPLVVVLEDAPLLGAPVPWWLPLGVVVGISTLAAYLLGIAGNMRLGTRVASFVGLLEVLFAVLAAWLLLGDLPTPVQLVGGACILVGVVLVRMQREDAAGVPVPVPVRRRPRTRSALGRRSADARGPVRARS